MHEINLQSVLQWIFFALEQMLLGRHVIALVPVSLPLPENWKSRLNAKRNVIRLSFSIAGTNIANIIIVVQA